VPAVVGLATARGWRFSVASGRRHDLEANDVAETVMKALTARGPRLRRRSMRCWNWTLPRIAPKRMTDFVIEQALALKPDPKRSLKGIGV